MAKPGPAARYGERSKATMYWPVEHRQRYEREAARRGLTFSEYMIRIAARAHNIPVPDDPEPFDQELPLGA